MPALPRGLRLVHPRVRFRWERHVHVAARSPGIRVTLCGRVSVGEPADPAHLSAPLDPRTGAPRWEWRDPARPELSLCPRCSARI